MIIPWCVLIVALTVCAIAYPVIITGELTRRRQHRLDAAEMHHRHWLETQPTDDAVLEIRRLEAETAAAKASMEKYGSFKERHIR